MNLARNVLGAHAVDFLEHASRESILTIGSDHLTRGELADLGCYNFVAARNLSGALNQLGVKNLRDVFDNYTPRDLALPHVGVIALAVLGAAFEAKGIGGEIPLETYVAKHQAKVTTFDTVKARIAREDQQRLKRPRRRGRR